MATFKARARAVDMLGRQQIAGIPTAINELFKNAHDAYAKNVTGDFFRSERLLVIRDDGVGMSPDDFVEKWLVVGTESKVRGGITPPPNHPVRPVLGEKGIGRLAVAAAGPQVLVLSRSRTADVMTFALVNWTLFTASGIDLDEVQVPITHMPLGVVPDKSHLTLLVDRLLANVEDIKTKLTNELYLTVKRESAALLAIDPREIRRRFRGPSLESVPGTEFWISPTDEMLAHDISGNPNDETEPAPLLKMLVGFSDTMVPGSPPPPMTARFIDHRSKDNSVNVIGDSEFFTPEDFAIADHRISGSFDEYGQFSGLVSVYGSDAVKHLVSWPGSKGQKTSCGPFTLNLAYVQGTRSASRLSPEDFNRTTQKLIRVGGLYVYRDRVRILPYGNHDFDWLDVERERSKSASDYFWSYRRMFGVVGISSSSNFQLQEKAGREGFRANAAYREFRDLLQNFLVQTARDFFREDSTDDTWRTTRAELRRADDARRRHENQSRQRRSNFRKALLDAEAALNLGKPEQEAGQLLSTLEDELNDAVSDPDTARAAQRVLVAEGRAQRSISDLRAKYRLSRPRGIALPGGVLQDFESYQHEYELLEVKLFQVTRIEVERRSANAAQRLGSALDRRRRLEAGLDQTFKDAQAAVVRVERETLEVFELLGSRVVQTVQASKHLLEDEIRTVQSVLNSSRTDELSDQQITDLRRSLEDRVTQAADLQVSVMGRLRDRLRLLTGDKAAPSEGDIVDVLGSLEQEVVSLRERADEDLDLAQLGLALQVINHEFSASIRSVRRNLQRLRSWADANRALRPVYSDLRASFEHLDAYLRLFTPLNKRLYRRGTVVKGSDVEKFILDLFQERISSSQISFEVTESFRSARVMAYPSTIYPVFVNLVDNAIFWLMTRSTPRIIRMAHTGQAWTVSDNGPGVPTKDHGRIFELGFSRKPNGRGMGLHISRDVLRKEGWDLQLADTPLGGASFVLRPPSSDEPAVAEEDSA